MGVATNFLITWDEAGAVQSRVYSKTASYVGGGTVIPIYLGTKLVFANRAGFFGSSHSWLVVAEYNAGVSVEDWNLVGAEINDTGLIYSTQEIVGVNNNQINPTVIGLGDTAEVFVAWVDYVSGTLGPGTVRGRRVRAGPILTSPDPIGGILIGGTVPLGSQLSGHSEDFDRYFVTWTDQRTDGFSDIYGARFQWSTSTVMDPNGFLISKSANRETSPAIAGCGGKYLVAWADTRNGTANEDIYGSILDSGGNVLLNNIAIATHTGAQNWPSIACDGTNFYVVWNDTRSGTADVYGNGINSTTGAKLLGHDVAIAKGASTQQYPKIAYGGGFYQVVYENDSFVWTTRLTASTGLIAAAGQKLTDLNGSKPDIDFDGSRFLVVAQHPAGDVFGVFVSSTNAFLPYFWIEASSGDQTNARLRWDGSSYTVVYQDTRNMATTGSDIYARSVSSVGVVSAAFAVATSSDNEFQPVIANRNGSINEVVYWRGSATTLFDYAVWGQSLSAGAISGTPFVISSVAGVREMTPAVACRTTLSCVVPYRWFDPADHASGIDRIKARVVSY